MVAHPSAGTLATSSACLFAQFMKLKYAFGVSTSTMTWKIAEAELGSNFKLV